MQYILSAEQNHILKALDDQDQGLKVKYLDKIVAIQTLVVDAINQLKKGKSIKIVSPDPGILNILEQTLTAIGLSEYSLRIDNNESISVSKISKLRANLKQKNTPKNSDVKQYEFEFIDKDLLKEFQNLNTPILENCKVKDFPQILSLHQANFKKGNTISIDKIWALHPTKEYAQVLNFIAKIASDYEPIYGELEKSEVLSSEVISTLSDTKAINQTIEKLERIEVRLEIINDSFQNIANDYSHSFLNQKEAEKDAFLSKIKETILSIARGEADPESKKSNFSFLKKNKAKNLLKEIYNELMSELHTYDKRFNVLSEDIILTNEKAVSNLQEAFEYLRNKISSNDSSFKKVEKHLSILNQENEEWISLSQSLSEYLTYLKDENILLHKFENNSKSLLKQKQLLSSIIVYTKRAIARLENYKDFYSFQSQYNKNQCVRAILNELAFHPKESWVSLFEQAYFQQKKSELSDLLLPHSKRRLVKKSLPMQSTALDFASKFPHYCTSLFPIILSQEQTPVTCDFTYVINPKNFDDNYRIFFSEFTKEDFNDITEVKDYMPLYLNDYSYSESLSKMPSTEKIRAAKKLAKLLLANNQNLKIYQVKEASIVSLLPSFEDQNLERILMDKGGKIMQMDDIYHSLVECLLVSERENYLLVKDGLIQSEHADTYLWQFDILNKYKNAGVKIRSVYTKDLLQGLNPISEITNEIFSSRNEIISTEQNITSDTQIQNGTETVSAKA